MNDRIILISNDDGVNAPGINILAGIMRWYGRVCIVAPEEPMSGMGHAVTVRHPLRLRKLEETEGFSRFSCNGTPADAVKLGIQVVLRKKPDLVVSGINHGSNASINILYSGTMAAVLEGVISGVPSIGFSLADYAYNADFSACEKYIRKVVENVLQHGLPDGTCLNVNIPPQPASQIRGIRICKQGQGMWMEEFDERRDPHNREYYWLTGAFASLTDGEDTDDWALQNNYVSVVPAQVDLTAYKSLEIIKKWSWNAE
ncbi:MAG: 5'/3'-nucleotidase SurE [Bacteroidales bacterium]|nr:5'/3'-nucleotidase SurE [Lentimicrobiaceae bacterium]MDD5694129.1 5'/3'-nucleotidase SurE [Bacteroidales bacterium]